ncbi:acylphosphatase [Streptomyces antimicrobicus]|uniref:Acylphosphatase n=1 Tax=Streptomyces antimicrobicus TaxID=2883108 RepID=A0ABS8BAU4_9ACTN|nr:acylphosphatase [Streptomyces antimicrobicus]MCB5181717.1 acylphosphatase [Streptomyces antimicrobicus]
MVRTRVVVSGRVQGVYFRDSCRTEALAHGVTGWVRNLPGGQVEAVFEGAEDAVARMVGWMRTGPPTADVRGVETYEEPPSAEPDPGRGFEVRPTPRVG